MSIKSFLIKKRIAEAANLLLYTDHSIAEICDLTGFSDQSYMTGLFRRILGTTPKKYRETRNFAIIGNGIEENNQEADK